MKETIEVKFIRLKHNLNIPAYATSGSAGMDLTAAISAPMEFKPLERKLVPTGIVIELPLGYEAQVRPRSGLSIKHGITMINCVGTVDEDYRGELCVPMVNLSAEPYAIQPGDRIAQMIISPVQKVKLVETLEVSETGRSTGGFGSTGR